jgi:arsenate reductase
MLKGNGGEMRKLFNTAGRDYREQKLGEKLPTLSESAAFDLLTANGNLIKRPFLIGEGVTVVGFDPAVWAQRLAGLK